MPSSPPSRVQIPVHPDVAAELAASEAAVRVFERRFTVHVLDCAYGALLLEWPDWMDVCFTRALADRATDAGFAPELRRAAELWRKERVRVVVDYNNVALSLRSSLRDRHAVLDVHALVEHVVAGRELVSGGVLASGPLLREPAAPHLWAAFEELGFEVELLEADRDETLHEFALADGAHTVVAMLTGDGNDNNGGTTFRDVCAGVLRSGRTWEQTGFEHSMARTAKNMAKVWLGHDDVGLQLVNHVAERLRL